MSNTKTIETMIEVALTAINGATMGDSGSRLEWDHSETPGLFRVMDDQEVGDYTPEEIQRVAALVDNPGDFWIEANEYETIAETFNRR